MRTMSGLLSYYHVRSCKAEKQRDAPLSSTILVGELESGVPENDPDLAVCMLCMLCSMFSPLLMSLEGL